MLIQEKVYHISRTSAEVTFSIFQETICLVFFPWNSFIQPCHIFWCLNLETPLLPFLVFGLLTHFWIDLICRFQIIPIILCLCKPCLYFPIEILQIGWVFWRQKNHNFDTVHVKFFYVAEVGGNSRYFYTKSVVEIRFRSFFWKMITAPPAYPLLN